MFAALPVLLSTYLFDAGMSLAVGVTMPVIGPVITPPESGSAPTCAAVTACGLLVSPVCAVRLPVTASTSAFLAASPSFTGAIGHSVSAHIDRARQRTARELEIPCVRFLLRHAARAAG